MKRYYKCFYGSTASIQVHKDGTATLRMSAGNTRTAKDYKTERGAKIAMGRASDEWREVQA